MHHRHAATTTEVVADIPHMSALTDKQCRQVLMSWGGDGRRLYRGASGDGEGGMDTLQRSSLCIVGMLPPLQR